MDREAWRSAIHGVAKSWTWLSDWIELIEQWNKLSSINGVGKCVFQFTRGYQIYCPIICYFGMLTKKKSTMWELWVKFYLGQNEDYSPGGSITDTSQKVPWRGSREVSIFVILGKRGVPKINHIYCRRFLLVLWALLFITRNRHHHEGF